MEIKDIENGKWSYCTKCICNQNFILVNDKWVCEQCGKPLQFALVRGTIVTEPKKEEVWQLK